MHMMSQVKVHSWTTYHTLLIESEELPIKVYTLKLTMGFQQQLGHLSPSWLVTKATSLSHTKPNKDLTLGTNQQPCGKHHGVYLIGIPMTTQPYQKQHMMMSRRLFLLKSGTLSISQGRDQSTSTSRIRIPFLKYECELYLKQPLAPPQCKIIVAYRTSNNRLATKIGRWVTTLSPQILDYATFLLYYN